MAFPISRSCNCLASLILRHLALSLHDWLVVDDEPPIVEVVCHTLEDEDIIVVPCEHGLRALPCIRALQPELVILDIQMPIVDGIQIFQQMRADPVTKDTPVIFFTANEHVLRQRLPNYKALNAELLPKPFHIFKLMDLVHKFLGN